LGLYDWHVSSSSLCAPKIKKALEIDDQIQTYANKYFLYDNKSRIFEVCNNTFHHMLAFGLRGKTRSVVTERGRDSLP